MEPVKLPQKIWLKNARLLDPALNLDVRGDLLIEKGVIADVATGSKSASGWDLQGAIVCPGFFDLHVHLREPGFEDAETIRSGQEAAAAGGFSAVAAMPNTNPPLDHAGIVRWVIERAASFPVAVHPVAAMTKGRKGEELSEMVELRQAGAIAFSDDGSWVANSGVMRRALEYSLLTSAPIISHAEDSNLSMGGTMNEGEISTRLGLAGIPRSSEDAATIRDLLLAEYTGGKLHLAHVSTAGAVAALQAAHERGVRASGEASPHHLTLTDQAVVGYDTSTKMKPPLREAADVASLWEALKSGVLSAIATDHAPHAIEDKEVPYDEASFGAIGLETAVALIWDRGVIAGRITAGEMVRLFCHGPRAIVGLPIPAIQLGAPAELTLFHPDEAWDVDPKTFFSKSANCPFKGWKLTGRPWGIIKGIWWAGRIQPEF
jgi:dihydroorotase